MEFVAQPVYRDAPATLPRIDESTLAALACDVAFVSDESVPAHVLVARQIEHLPQPDIAGAMWELFDALRGEYEVQSFVPHPAFIADRVRQSRFPRERHEA